MHERKPHLAFVSSMWHEGVIGQQGNSARYMGIRGGGGAPPPFKPKYGLGQYCVLPQKWRWVPYIYCNNLWFQGKIKKHLVAFFMQTIKEMFCNILKCNFRFFRVSFCFVFVEYLVCSIGHKYCSSAFNFLYFDHTYWSHLSISCYSWFQGSVISLKIWHK